ncbi:MAG: HEPN domain-containing protein [Actinobacteria bacterium]|nr:HEPN domain-containing protein [Actinomycetota bacterium]MCG2818644.1 HEPN domain-containing protein [Actinomycetes bacterium]MBU4218167.1 HEPN domain-containing protein [Actinomycetota bacterium]MBU4358592.1 HEPN domain-containing protein [Actinomycetota bacterium]MBU4392093.1 HEPN domain-containing protein [Actinomycetota bacterium]
MPQDRPTPGSPHDWLARANGDLALAKAPLPEGAFLEDFCFHAQQAAEKALKAVYQHHGWVFRFTHDLDELVTGLKDHGLEIPSSVDEAIVLTSFAREARYPGFVEAVTDEEYHEAIRQAESVTSWAAKELGE